MQWVVVLSGGRGCALRRVLGALVAHGCLQTLMPWLWSRLWPLLCGADLGGQRHGVSHLIGRGDQGVLIYSLGGLGRAASMQGAHVVYRGGAHPTPPT